MKKRTRMHHDPVIGRGTSDMTGFHSMQPTADRFEIHGQYHLEGAVLDASSAQVVKIESRFAKIVRGVFG